MPLLKLRILPKNGRRLISHCNDPFLSKRAANYVPLSPLSFLKHTANHYPTAIAYVHGNISRTWGEVYNRINLFSDLLCSYGIEYGDVVSIIAPNTISIFEAHFAVPGAGAVLHSINIRQDISTISYQLQHAKSKLIIVDMEYKSLIENALNNYNSNIQKPQIIYSIDNEWVLINDNYNDIKNDSSKNLVILENIIHTATSTANSSSKFNLITPKDEWDAISLNYTSGTT
eukprot:gene14026-29862_t